MNSPRFVRGHLVWVAPRAPNPSARLTSLSAQIPTFLNGLDICALAMKSRRRRTGLLGRLLGQLRPAFELVRGSFNGVEPNDDRRCSEARNYRQHDRPELTKLGQVNVPIAPPREYRSQHRAGSNDGIEGPTMALTITSVTSAQAPGPMHPPNGGGALASSERFPNGWRYNQYLLYWLFANQPATVRGPSGPEFGDCA